jgi:hypothetical protein
MMASPFCTPIGNGTKIQNFWASFHFIKVHQTFNKIFIGTKYSHKHLGTRWLQRGLAQDCEPFCAGL